MNRKEFLFPIGLMFWLIFDWLNKTFTDNLLLIFLAGIGILGEFKKRLKYKKV
ncbi:MAG: hypothetical protein LBE36_13265 [Flavobacteriaceae bacterium]|jgi:hypothetical protein|nr:hypothetical protein [Flavobacteriaceae bacterium]